MKKRLFSIVATVALTLSLAACGGSAGGEISVQRADQLSAAGQAGERFAGMVVSDNVVEIKKDSEKSILELYVTEGQKVKAGEKLFTYDSAALEIELEKCQLEITKMNEEKSSYNSQIGQLQNQLNATGDSSARTRLMLEINTLKTKLMEIDYQMALKQTEEENLKEMLENIDITSPVDGTVRKIDKAGETNTYITIQQSNAYKVQGMLNEMNMASGLNPDTPVKILSRIDSSASWTGKVTNIDWENSSQQSGNNFGGGPSFSDSMTMSSSYPFYVELDDPTGLLLGQHVYIEIAGSAAPAPMEGLWIPSRYVVEPETNDAGETHGKVFVAHGSKLGLDKVTLGMYDDFTGCYEVLSGLQAQDLVADPKAPGCQKGAKVIVRDMGDFIAPQPDLDDLPMEEDLPVEEDLPMEEDFPMEEELPMEDMPAEPTMHEGSMNTPVPEEMDEGAEAAPEAPAEESTDNAQTGA